MLLALFCLCLLGAGRARAAGAQQPGTSTGTITVDVGWDRSMQEVAVNETCRFTLAPGSKALAELRKDGLGSCGGYMVLRDGKEADDDGWNDPPVEVTQTSPGSSARVEKHFTLYLARQSGLQDLTFTIGSKGSMGDLPQGVPTIWAVKVTAPGWSMDKIQGRVESQSRNAVVWQMQTASGPSKGATAAVTGSVSVQRFVKTTMPPSTRHQTRGEMVTVLGLAVGGIGLVAALLVAGLTRSAAPARWVVATLVLAVAVYPLGFSGIPSPVLPPNEVHVPVTITFGGGTSPDLVWTPGPSLGLWLWYVLPVAGWWLTRRTVTREPPSLPLLVACGLCPILSFLLMAVGGIQPPAGYVLRLTGLVTALAVGIPSIGALIPWGAKSGAARRWVPTATTLACVSTLIYFLGHAPVMAQSDPNINGFTVAAVWVLTWPAAAWLTSLIGPVLRRPLGPIARVVCFLTLWGILLSPFVVARATKPSGGVNPWSIYRVPFFTGYAGFPLCVMAVCGVVLQIMYLLRRGAVGDFGRAVEPVGRVLLVCGVITALGSPSLRTLSMWGQALAVLWAALGSLVLLPIGSAATSAKFRRVSRRAHARFVDQWVRTQLVWDARADYQRAARSALAEGGDDTSVSAFSDRWRALDVPGRCGDPATRLARAKRFALGTGAGVAPWTAALAGAAFAQVLALPWAIYILMTSATVGADGFMPFHLEEISKALRFSHWALYGFVYGYFYPLLRGLGPIGKAAALMAVVLPAEVLPMVTLTVDPQYTRNPSWNDMVVACGSLAGQTLVVCMGLGLGWEWWLARAAGMKWSQARNFRRLSSVTVPLGTVLIAGATAFVTVVAGAWAQQELVPPSGAPPAASSSHSPSTP